MRDCRGFSGVVRASLPAAQALASPAGRDARTTVPFSSPRVRRLEARYESMEQRHREDYDDLSRRYEGLKRRVGDASVRPAQGVEPAVPPDASTRGGAGARDNPAPDGMPAPEGAGDLPSEL